MKRRATGLVAAIAFAIIAPTSAYAENCQTVKECAQRAVESASQAQAALADSAKEFAKLRKENAELKQQLASTEADIRSLIAALDSRLENTDQRTELVGRPGHCVLASQCSSGYRDIAVVGIIMSNAGYANNPFGPGGGYNSGFTWSHPHLCCR